MLDKSPARPAVNVPNDLAAHWMPFTANRAFKKAPRLLAGAKDMHYFTVDGRKIIDAAAGMWCCNAGHGRSQISAAIAKQAETLDYAPPFQFGIPQAFELASRIADLAPDGLDHVFFCNSGSEAADTALKIALAYHQIQRPGHPHPPDRPRARLSRRRLRRHFGRRHRQQPQDVRHAAGRRRSSSPHL